MLPYITNRVVDHKSKYSANEYYYNYDEKIQSFITYCASEG